MVKMTDATSGTSKLFNTQLLFCSQALCDGCHVAGLSSQTPKKGISIKRGFLTITRDLKCLKSILYISKSSLLPASPSHKLLFKVPVYDHMWKYEGVRRLFLNSCFLPSAWVCEYMCDRGLLLVKHMDIQFVYMIMLHWVWV